MSRPITEPPKIAAAEPATPPRTLDDESRAWLDALAATGYVRDEAVARLHELLLRAARFEVARRRLIFPHLRGGDHDDLAQQSADDALVAILAKLPSFRGDSRFTTWAYKFALYEAAVNLRRRGWQDRELPLEPETWPEIASRALSPADHAVENELLDALQQAIRSTLSDHHARCSSRSPSTGCRSTSWQNVSTRPAARCTRPCTTRAASCARGWPPTATTRPTILAGTNHDRPRA